MYDLKKVLGKKVLHFHFIFFFQRHDPNIFAAPPVCLLSHHFPLSLPQLRHPEHSRLLLSVGVSGLQLLPDGIFQVSSTLSFWTS